MKQKFQKKAIVLGANYQYQDQLVTTMKSVCYHNRHIRFYILNSDFPNEWFRNLNQKLVAIDCEVINARVNSGHIQQYKTNIHYATFLRYFISDFVEEDRVLYLDCDLVVTKDLSELFEMEMGNHPLFAVKDLGAQAYFGEYAFNAGVLLINNRYWKEHQIRKQLIELTNELHETVAQDDQSILNLLFKEQWMPLNGTYNTITLHTHFMETSEEETDDYPAIIHYLTERKPWSLYERSVYREVWWFYNGLEWSDMRQIHDDLSKKVVKSLRNEKLSAFVYTFSLDLFHMEELIQGLPDVHFYIAAPVVVAQSITDYLAYPNVSVLSDIGGQPGLIDEMIHRCDLLLDINADQEVDGIVSRFHQQGKPVYAFESMKHGEQGQLVYADTQINQMIADIQKLY